MLSNILNPFPTLLQCTIVYGTLSHHVFVWSQEHVHHIYYVSQCHILLSTVWAGLQASSKKKKKSRPSSLEFAHLCYKQPYLLVPAHLPLAAAYFLSLVATLYCAELLVPDDLHAIVWLPLGVSLPISDNTERTLVMCKKRYSNLTKIHLLSSRRRAWHKFYCTHCKTGGSLEYPD